MATKFNFNGIEISMSANFKGGVYNVWGDKMWHNKYIVTIRTTKGKTTFTYYDSYHNYSNGVCELKSDDLKSSLDCFLSDSLSYENTTDFFDFCKEFGYDDIEDYGKAKKAYNGCKRSYNSAIRIFGDIDTICNVLNAINESY